MITSVHSLDKWRERLVLNEASSELADTVVEGRLFQTYGAFMK